MLIRNLRLDYRVWSDAAMPKADVIFVTHDHYDHLDKDAIRLLTKKSTQLIMNPASVKTLGKGQSMANGDKLQLTDNISVEAVPAYNITKGDTSCMIQTRTVESYDASKKL